MLVETGETQERVAEREGPSDVQTDRLGVIREEVRASHLGKVRSGWYGGRRAGQGWEWTGTQSTPAAGPGGD